MLASAESDPELAKLLREQAAMQQMLLARSAKGIQQIAAPKMSRADQEAIKATYMGVKTKTARQDSMAEIEATKAGRRVQPRRCHWG